MDRRGFLGTIGLALGTAALPSRNLVPDRRERLKAAGAIPVMRADGTGYILGVATENVRAGDIVQIQVSGWMKVNTA